MLSYRHRFHAGNFADVLKHFCLFHALSYLNQKVSPYVYIDTHAGAGLYDLNSPDAQKNKEYVNGIARLRQQSTLPKPLADFVTQLDAWLPNSTFYLGSPYIAAQLLRKNDSLHAYELHPMDVQHLRTTLKNCRPNRTFIHRQDGFQGVLSLLPPPQHRALILIDPSYEDKTDYIRVFNTLKKAIARFSQGVFLIWYPHLAHNSTQIFSTQLHTLANTHGNYMKIDIDVHPPSADGYGMYGCGMLILNPPYVFPEIFDACKLALYKALNQNITQADNTTEIINTSAINIEMQIR